MTQEKVVSKFDCEEKIRGLLAKAEGASTEAEAEVCRNMAFKLMQKYAIDEADIRAKSGKSRNEQVKHHFIPCGGIYKDSLIELGFAVAAAIRGVMTVKGQHNGTPGFTLYGYEDELNSVKYLYSSLVLQMTTALNREWKSSTTQGIYHHATAMQKFKFKRSFGIAYARRIEQRFIDMQKQEEAEVTPGTALALVDLDAKVKTWMDLNLLLASSKTNLSMSGLGYKSGDAAGCRADLGQTDISNSDRRSLT